MKYLFTYRIITVLLILLVSINGYCQFPVQQPIDTSYSNFDSVNGNTFNTHLKREIIDSSPPLTTFSIITNETVISPKGDTLYKRISEQQMRGCIVKTFKEFIIISDSIQARRSIKFIGSKKYVIKNYNSAGKVESKEKVEYMDPYIWGVNQFRSKKHNLNSH